MHALESAVKQWFFGAAVAVAFVNSGHAAYFVEAGALSNLDHEQMTSSFEVVVTAGGIETFTIGSDLGVWAGDASAIAGPGFVGGSSHTSINITNHQCCLSGNSTRAGGTRSRMDIDDVVISGPAASVGGTLNLEFDGSFSAAANFANALGDAGGYAEVSISILLPNFSGGGGARLGVNGANILSLTNSGLLAGYSGGPLFLAIPIANLPVNTPFGIHLELATTTLATYNVAGTGPAPVPIFAELFSTFDHTFSFATAGPVFTLSDGFTVNSAQGAIVDNQFVGLAAAAPEPGPLLLVLTGLAGLSLVQRRRG